MLIRTRTYLRSQALRQPLLDLDLDLEIIEQTHLELRHWASADLLHHRINPHLVKLIIPTLPITAACVIRTFYLDSVLISRNLSLPACLTFHTSHTSRLQLCPLPTHTHHPNQTSSLPNPNPKTNHIPPRRSSSSQP